VEIIKLRAMAFLLLYIVALDAAYISFYFTIEYSISVCSSSKPDLRSREVARGRARSQMPMTPARRLRQDFILLLCLPTAPTLPLKLRGFGTSRWQLDNHAISFPEPLKDVVALIQRARPMFFAAREAILGAQIRFAAPQQCPVFRSLRS
jgi:hypothetical protein